MSSAHVVPVGDLIEHEVADSCACGPRTEPVPGEDGSIGWVHVHHSLDGREAYEGTPEPEATVNDG